MGATTVEIPASHVAMVSYPDPAAHSALLRATARCLRAGPDRISFIKVLKHVRRSVIRQSAQTSVQIKQLMVIMAAKVRRKLDNGIRRLREADRCLKRPASKCVHSEVGSELRFRPPVQVAGTGSQGSPARARVVASSAVSPWLAAESR